MADTKYIGQNYTPPDLVAKVTGKARWAEDFRAEGMLFAKLLASPMPHARVRNIDARAALAMAGVKAGLPAGGLPGPRRVGTRGARAARARAGVKAVLPAATLPELGPTADRTPTTEPLYAGEPILAVA